MWQKLKNPLHIFQIRLTKANWLNRTIAASAIKLSDKKYQILKVQKNVWIKSQSTMKRKSATRVLSKRLFWKSLPYLRTARS